MKIENVHVYGLENSFRVSKFAFATDTSKMTKELTPTIENLAQTAKGEGHDHFLVGIVVQFDLTISNKAWVEAERYHFFDIVTSQSTMHKIKDFDTSQCFNEYVTSNTIKEVERLQQKYKANPSIENKLRLLYNIPSGIELTAGMTTNYLQLKTMYSQRRHHQLPDWQYICDWIETLPHSELITGKGDNLSQTE